MSGETIATGFAQSNPNPVLIQGSDGTNAVIIKTNAAGEIVTSDGTLAALAATELTRPSDTNAYAVGDAIANSTTAGSVTPLQFTVARSTGGAGRIIGAKLAVNSATAFGAMRLHLFNTTPFAAAGFQADNAALALTYTAVKTGSAGTNPNYIGYIDFTTFTALSSAAVSIGVSDLTELNFDTPAGVSVIFGLLEARAIFTPASAETFNISFDVIQD